VLAISYAKQERTLLNGSKLIISSVTWVALSGVCAVQSTCEVFSTF